MFLNRPFLSAILFSFAVHVAVFFSPANFKVFINRPKDLETKITYLKSQKDTQKTAAAKGQALPRVSSKARLQQTAPPPYADKTDLLKGSKDSALLRPAFSKPAFVRPDIIAIKKKIVVPPIDIKKINNPTYISYYQLVREKIRHAAYNNFAQAEEGEVYLTFTISSDGYIQDIRLVDEKSSPSNYLKKVGLASIKAASPFPRFPKELDYPQLSFNVIISFQIE